MPKELTNRQTLYRAISRRDSRYDGRVYVAVKSTGIYCRPICQAKRPKLENCLFYLLAAQAEKNGYRPCRLCRPELAPENTAFRHPADAKFLLAARAMRRIEDGVLMVKTLEALAEEFGVTGRELGDMFDARFGVSPSELAQTRRLGQAKQLLTETTTGINEIASGAGFPGLRQFNHIFKKVYRASPKELRGTSSRKISAQPDVQRLRIDYRPPFNWQCLSDFLRMRAIPGVEYVDSRCYFRAVKFDNHLGWISVEPSPDEKLNALQLTLSNNLMPVALALTSRVKNMFDVRANIDEIERQLNRDPELKPFVKKHRGMRLPGAFDGFELLLRAILGQQISVKAATTLAGRFAQAYGTPINTPYENLNVSTPQAEAIAETSVETIRALGLPLKRAQTIKRAACLIAEGAIELVPGADPVAVATELVKIPGIGEWTADYVAMRALAWPDAFPSGDLGVKKALGLTRRREIIERATHWRPWRGYATLHLWLSLASKR